MKKKILWADEPPPTLPHRCLRVGITGGIGSGKSTVCRIFNALGIPIFYADIWAKHLLNLDPHLKVGVTSIFGPTAYTPEGQYNRSTVAQMAFGQPSKLAALNALVHPVVEAESLRWHQDRAAEGAPYTLKEAALMLESGSHRHLDFLIVVTAPEALRIERTMRRDNLSEEQVRARIASQLPEIEKIALADFIIRNDGTRLLTPQVMNTHHDLLLKSVQKIY